MPTVVWERDRAAAQPVFFPVSKLKLTVMSLCTAGLYPYYWFYRNWKLVQARSRRRMMPFWRAVFSLIWAHDLFDRIEKRARDEGVRPGFSPSPMTGLFILLSLSWRLPDPYWLVAVLSFVPLLPVQRAATEINRRVSPDAPANAKFGALNIAGIVIGSVLLLLVIASFLLPAEQS